jgi:hypothetical protein
MRVALQAIHNAFLQAHADSMGPNSQSIHRNLKAIGEFLPQFDLDPSLLLVIVNY